MIILGITAFFHDSSASILRDGEVLFGIQEERLTKIKHDSSFPINAIKFCLNKTEINIKDIDVVVYYEKPLIKFDRIINSFISFAPKGFKHFKKVILEWSTKKLFIKKIITKKLSKLDNTQFRADILFSSHHLSHAALGYFTTDFTSSAILVIDAVGENATTSIFMGKRNKLKLLKEYAYPHSLGLLYSSFTQFLGFRVNSDEYKLMGLSGYGNKSSEETKKFIELIYSDIISIENEGNYFILNQDYFQFQFGESMIDINKFEFLFSLKQREETSQINQSHCNLALAIQTVLECLLIRLVEEVKLLSRSDNLIVVGGVALNTVAMGNIRKLKLFKNFSVPFAPGDSGTSIGALLAIWHLYLNNKERIKISPYLGNEFSNNEIKKYLIKNNIDFEYFDKFEDVIKFTCDVLTKAKIVAWFQNRSEFGERALGNRSILADPSIIYGKSRLNSQIKFRESFRPFAPSIIEEEALNYFEMGDSRYMQFVTKILPKYRCISDVNETSFENKVLIRTSKFASVTHVDYTSRLQTVSKKDNSKFWELLKKYEELSGSPILVNTSLNLKNQPIVEDIEDVFFTFNNSGIDYLIIENFIISK
ncbi:hypothetical protein EC396_13315 [Lutibacter sp. HS1-25]|uniref:carbamoyltransferase family protein n=1 Tax=Lutibacter sp. HS1-25 TaxID=2485000 RepID=UPI001011D611|nr:carbamoyltransferase N-terminal domain-containing protein [Lutibacter sp. HS1-25]RXP46854.1 hypothetical protein EC396_13315 [Lutibacter sp. HS1-25]